MSATFKTSFPAIDQAVKIDESFVCFDTGLSGAEKAAIAQLHVAQTDSYDNFGKTEVVEQNTARFLESLGNTKELAAQAAQSVAGVVRNVLKAMGAETGWVTLRASTPTDAYDVPRWHQDGYFYAPFEGDQRKAAITLMGSGTLFKNLPDGLRTEFNKFRGAPPDMELRQQVDALISGVPTETITAGEGAFFVVGSSRGAIHSEPPIHEKRLFLSVVPGTKEQIEELRQNWKAKETTYTP